MAILMHDSVAPITIIIPVFNREQVIRRALSSVFNQTYTEWSLIVVDDCSTDRTVEMVRSFNDSRIHLLSTSQNLGASAARNVGIRSATTEFIALLDSDDVFHPEFLSTSLLALRTSTQHYFSYVGVGEISDINFSALVEKPTWEISIKVKEKERPYLYQLRFGTSAGIVFRRELFEKVGYFDETLRAAEDTDFFIRTSQLDVGLAIHKVLVFKDNVSPGRLTHNFQYNARAYQTIIEKNKGAIKADSYLIYRWYYKAMWLHFYSGDRKEAYFYFKELLKSGKLFPRVIFLFMAGIILSPHLFRLVHQKLSAPFLK